MRFTVTHLSQWLICHELGVPWDRAPDMLCGPLDLDGLPDGVAALVARHAPTTAVMAPFWRGLLTAPST